MKTVVIPPDLLELMEFIGRTNSMSTPGIRTQRYPDLTRREIECMLFALERFGLVEPVDQGIRLWALTTVGRTALDEQGGQDVD